MNPQSAALPAVSNQASPEMPVTNVVENIPVHTQAAQPAPVNEDAELDKIMHDVGQEMKKEDKKPAKHGFFGLGHKKPESSFAAAAARPSKPVPAPPAVVPAAPTAAAILAAPAPFAKPAVAPAAVQVKKSSSVPVFVIFVAIIVTGFLAVAAVAAYRQ